MIIKIDWLSFTGRREATPDASDRLALSDAIDWLDALDPRVIDTMGDPTTWVAGKGRKPYSTSWKSPTGGTTLYTHPRLPHFLVEIAGRGCDELAQHEDAHTFLEIVAPHLTRLDLACDIMTETRPEEFADLRDQTRFRSHSKVVSDSGDTFYVGSKTSDRYARVYRYNPPHDRAHLLRVEYVLKAQEARQIALELLEVGQEAVAAALGEKFGWSHPDWQVQAVTDYELLAYRPDRRKGKTVFWLADTIAPLMVRLHEEGIIDAEGWFKVNVLPKLKKSDTL